MTRIFDPDSEADIPHRVTINLDRDDDDHLGQTLQDNFLTSINHARTLCSDDARGPQSIRYTVHDPGSPLLLLTIIAHDDAQRNFGTSLIMERRTCYVMSFIAGGHWRVTKEEHKKPPKYEIRGATKVSFGVSYQEIGGTTSLSRVGASPLLNALYTLHTGDESKWNLAYCTLCIHIAESMRFHRIATVVSRGLGGPTRYQSLILTIEDQELIKNWSAVSRSYSKNELGPLLASKILISSIDEVPQHVALLLRQT